MEQKKFIVVNTKFLKVLTKEENVILGTLLEKIERMNCLQNHNYIVVNSDEPYASDIGKIIKYNEEKKNNSLKD